MHTIKLIADVNITPFPVMKKGEIRLADDLNTGELMSRQLCVAVNHAGCGDMLAGSEKTDSILLIRPGGFGDLLFLTPIIRKLKETYKTVAVSCFKKYRYACAGAADRFEEYPVLMTVVRGYDRMMGYDGIIEAMEGWESVDAQKLHIIDVFAKPLGLVISDGERRLSVKAHKPWKRGKRKRIAIHVYASSPIRSYPEAQTGRLIHALDGKGFEVFLLGSPNEVRTNDTLPKGVRNLSREKLSIEESVNALASCDALIAPDSIFCHIAGALGIPTVALYGPFPSRLRILSDSQHAIDGKAHCAPCFTHGIRWPEGKPCAKAGRCVALESIHPQMVLDELGRFL